MDSRYTQVIAMRIRPMTMLATAGVEKRRFTLPRIGRQHPAAGHPVGDPGEGHDADADRGAH